MRSVIEDLRLVFEDITTRPFSVPEPTNFPFHTDSARMVWQAVKKLINKNKEAGANEIIRLALSSCEIPSTDLTPEDMRLLEMAVEHLQTHYPED